jgi:hypothetical protein
MIAYADRGTCTFKTKALNAQSGGATALIVGQNTTAPPFQMTDDATISTAITIPTVMISQADAASIKTQITNQGAVEECDALLVGGGDPLYVCYWIQRSGLLGLLPSLHETVWVGVSGGSLVMGPCVGEEFVSGSPPATGSDRALGLVDFAMFPHLDHDAMPEHSMANAERWAAGLPVPGYAMDDETASRWSAAPSKSSPRGTGRCSLPVRKQARRARGYSSARLGERSQTGAAS